MLSMPKGLWAQWIEDGAALSTATGFQRHSRIASDGMGGALVVWEDERGSDPDIYVQRVDASGVVLWTADGVPFCTAADEQDEPTIAPDGTGGAIVAWEDRRNGGAQCDIYVQRADASGTAQWTADGLALCAATDIQINPKIVSDGAGGAIIAWDDRRTGILDIYVQRIDAAGVVQWTADGLGLCTATDHQYECAIASDGAGGAIVAWRDSRSGNYDIYAQRVNASGTPQWTADGVALCTSSATQFEPKIISDGAGGAIVTWHDDRNGYYDIYARRVDASGTPLWTADGVALCTETSNQRDPTIASDGAEGAIVAWTDYRGADGDIYAQLVNASGSAMWTPDGLPVCTATGTQYFPDIISDGTGGAIVTWQDERQGGANPDTYAQRLALGTIQWTADGVALSAADGHQKEPKIASDGSGGAIVAWHDNRPLPWDVYAQRIFAWGELGHVVPHVRGISDVPNDQGGKIELQWDRAFVLEDPNPDITYYSLWRQLPQAMSTLTAAGPGITDISIDFNGSASRTFAGSSGHAWEWIANIPVRLTDTYAYMVESRYDSTSSDTGWQRFVVTGHTSEPFIYYDSPPDSGYSVDNLSPCMPMALAAEYVGGFELHLHWNPNTESDLHHYAIYRGTTADFIPDEANRIATQTDTSHVDTDFSYGEHFYRVSAIDVHENESAFSLLTPDMITGVPGEHPHLANVLFQNAPNPFHYSTRIAFYIQNPGHVRLSVFDAKGRLVRTLVDEIRQTNHYVEQWDGRKEDGAAVPAGTYFCSLESKGWKASKKMTVAR